MASKQLHPTPAPTDDAITPVQPAPPPRDKAAEFLAQHGEATFSYDEEKAVLRRIDTRVLLLILGAYFFQQLDKSTLGYVSIFGIIEDAKLQSLEYSWLGSVLYVAQLVMQPAAAYILVRLPTGKVIGTAIILWGVSQTLMAACSSFGGLMATRFLLGSFESMIAPSCVAVTQMWWRRSEQTMRTGLWNGMNGVTLVVGSLVTYGLGHIEGGSLFKYQTIFLFCGLLTVAYGALFIWLMPDSPMEAKYLTERERVVAVGRLRANQMGVASRTWRWEHVRESLADVKTWLWFVLIVAISIASGGIGTFGSLIIKSFGFTSFQAILLNIPAGALQVISIVGSAWLATRFQAKGLVIACLACLPTTGAVLMLTVPREQKGVLLFGYYLVMCMGAITPLLYAWQAQNTAGDTKKKTTSGVVFVGMCIGNIIGPLLYNINDAPLYRPGLISNVVMFLLVGVLGLTIPVYLRILNARHAMMREQLGKRADVVDESMMRKDHIGMSKAVEVEEGDAGRTDVETDKGLSDVTDLENEDFIYTY